jgi:hypothetical protein
MTTPIGSLALASAQGETSAADAGPGSVEVPGDGWFDHQLSWASMTPWPKGAI